MRLRDWLPLACLVASACAAQQAGPGGEAPQTAPASLEKATFAGGCFWCMEAPFEKLAGVHAVVSGYTGGHVDRPSYEQVGRGGTGHAEAIQVLFDPAVITYEDLLQVFWRQVNPTDPGGQFVDRGDQYRTGIFVHDEAQRRAAESSKAALAASGRFDAPIVTPIEDAGAFYAAEDYHQDFYRKSPGRYHRYRKGSGRDRYLDAAWGSDRTYAPRGPRRGSDTSWAKPSDEELQRLLTPLQYRVTQQEATERPFSNEYWNEHREGIYVDVVSGEPLYSSKDKFDSGTGWPSFTRALVPENLKTKTDRKLGYPRTELRSARADSHLGHLFDDGPPPTGKRHCINSAALRFVPKDRLEAEGYGRFLGLFETP